MSFRFRIFSALARFDVRRPWLVLTLALMLAAASIYYTQARLQFNTGQDDLISANNRDSRNYLRYTKEFPDIDGLVVVVKVAGDPARAEHFAEALAQRLKPDGVNVKSVFYRIDAGAMGNSAMLFLSDGDLAQLRTRIASSLPMLEAYGANPTLATLFGIINAQFNHAIAAIANGDDAGGGEQASIVTNMTLLDAILGGMNGDTGADASLPWNSLNPIGQQGGVMGDGYLASDNGKYLLMQVAPGDGVRDGPDPVAVIQAQVNAVRAQFPGLEAGMTGGPALAYAEASSTQHDMMLASILAVAGLIALLVIPFRGVVEPCFAIIALLTGVAWSFGFTTLAVGHLNLLSAVFTSVLAGIGIDFPIHLMARYDEARRRGLAMPQAVELAVVNTGTGVFASACIMALAFLMPMFTDFKGIAELGLVSAAGLFMCLISALLVFPALVALRDRNRPAHPRPRLSLAPKRSLLEKLFARPGPDRHYCDGGDAGRCIPDTRGPFQSGHPEAAGDRRGGRALREHTAARLQPILVVRGRIGADPRGRRSRSGSLSQAAGGIGYPDDLRLHPGASGAETRPAERTGTRVGADCDPQRRGGDSIALMRELDMLARRLEAMSQFDESGSVLKTAKLAEDAMARLKKDAGAFTAYEQRMATGLTTALATLKPQLSPGTVTEKNLPAILRERFIGTSGLYLVQIYPKGDIWEDAPLQRFVGALRTVDRDVTGPPIQTYNLATVMRQGYERAALLALIAVFIFVFADFRNLRDTLLATVPLIFGGAWLLEAMPLLGWEFNLANLFAVPIIIGMGVDNGVNMLYRWREERDKSSLILSTAVGKSVTVCSLTTIVAFAALITASHRGISSLGWVLSVGVTLILLATLIVLPALFELLGSRIQRAQQPGLSNVGSVGGNGVLIPEIVEPVAVDPPAPTRSSKSTGTHDL